MKIPISSFNRGMLWAGLSALCIACTSSLPESTREQISLEGNWGLQLDTMGVGISPEQLTVHCTDSLWLPGTTDLGKKGRYNTDYLSFSGIYFRRGSSLHQDDPDSGKLGRTIDPVSDGTHQTHNPLDRWKRDWIQ